jgi:hypothetical protein
MIYLKHNMGIMALSFYAIAKTFAVRSDIDEYFGECVRELNVFNTNSKNLLLSKGLYIWSPYLIPSKEIHFVKSPNFLSGLFPDRSYLYKEVAFFLSYPPHISSLVTSPLVK